MLISSALAGFAAIALQADPTRGPREAYAACLRRFVDSSIQGRKEASAFTSELPQQCQTEEQAYRQAMIRRDVAARVSQADAEEAANEEIEYSRQNSSESFADATAPR